MSLIDNDRAAWEAWKKSPYNAKTTQDLLDQMNGPIMTAVNIFRTASLPLPLLELEAKRQALEALKDYQPSYGTNMASYVTTMVKQRLSRYVMTNQNVVRIPEYTSRNVGSVLTAEKGLTEKFGRMPTPIEVSDHLSLPLKDVIRTQASLHRERLESALDDISSADADPNFERLMLAYYSLNPDEQHVFDYSTGSHGKPKLKSGEIATKLNLSAGRVSQIKEQIANKVKPYLV